MLVPGLDLPAASLQQMIPARQDPAIPRMGGEMRRLELARKAVEEIPTRLGTAVEDPEILPAERNGASPGAPLARHDPPTVLATTQFAAEASRHLASRELARQRGGGRVPAREISRLGTAKRASNEKDAKSFEEVGFALGVRTAQNIERRFRAEREGAIITEIFKRNPLDEHPLSAPMRMSNSHRHDNTQRPLLLEAFDHSGAQTVLQFHHDLLGGLRAQRVEHIA